jgi:antitoxin (DNA-binding transcriptional repressor) of toxin-antitoxin stability system
MFPIDLNKAKTQWARLIQSALSGEEVIITENDKPILRLVRVAKEKGELSTPRGRDEPTVEPHRQSGSARGLISMSDDFDEPLEDFTEYMQ